MLGQWFRCQNGAGGWSLIPKPWWQDEWQLRRHQELCLPGTVGRSWCWTQQGGQVPLPLPKGLDARMTCRDGTWRGKAVPWCSFQAGKSCHRMSVQPVRMPCLPKEKTVSSQKHTGRSLSQNILFRKLASQQQSRMLIWEKKMRCGPKSALACRLRNRKFEEAPEAAVARSAKGRAGWAGGPAGVCCLCRVLQSWLWSCKVSGIFLLQHKGIKLD